MTFRRTDIAGVFAFTCLFIAGCGGGTNANVNGKPAAPNANAAAADREPKTNAEELGVLVNIPFEAEDIVWKEEPGTKALVAVLRFAPADSAKVVAEAEKVRPPANVTLQSETWYPDELVAQSDTSGDDTLKGLSYAADMFLLPPYNEGRLVRVEGTDYFVLEVSIK